MIGTQDLLELVLSDVNSGVNASLSLTFVSEMVKASPTIQPMTVAMYLAKSQCNQGMQFATESSLVSSTSFDITSMNPRSLFIGFDGPSPSFLEPNANGTTEYCLLINTSVPFFADNAFVNLNILFIDRKLATSTINLTPKYAIYSSVFDIEYGFFDQWGLPFIVSDELELSCVNETVICGHTDARSSTGRVPLLLNETVKQSWRLFTRVSASLLGVPDSQPATAYGILIFHCL